PETGEKGLKKVEQTFIRKANTLVHVYVNNEEIKTTVEHPFWVVGKGWVEASKLKEGDTLLMYSGKTVKVTKIFIEKLQKTINVFNFRVADWHTYIVSDLDILVHNNNPCAQGGNKGNYKAGDKTPDGKILTNHAAERANERGFDDTTIDNIVKNNIKNRKKEIDKETGELGWRYQDARGNTVITSEWGDRIITVYSYPKSKNGGNFIPKPKR
ncbi:MAG TPA: polymorphic toxin-type HINT domain-containing protein, partial [Clostridia bacterium]